MMSTIYEPPVRYGSGDAEPPETGHTPGGRGGGRGRFAAVLMAVVAVLLAVALAAALAIRGRSATPAGTAASLSTSSIAAKVDPAVVDVNSTLGYQHATSSGTGIVLTSSGEVLTNNHVIEGATAISVTDVGNGRTYTATVVGYDETADIAVLQLQGASGLATATLGDSSAVKVGDGVVALGNAGGKGGTPSVSTGTVTALGQSITASSEFAGTSEELTGLIQTNADLQAGDSGGPLADSTGRVIGIDTAASSQFQFQPGTSGGSSVSYAVPVNKALTIAKQIEAGTSSATVHIGATAFLGVQLAQGDGFPAGPAASGVTVAGVETGSPAQDAGLAAGDVITSLDGQAAGSASAVSAIMTQHRPGDQIDVTWTDQSGQEHTATVVLATGPAG